jgi:hypothetical protein
MTVLSHLRDQPRERATQRRFVSKKAGNPVTGHPDLTSSELHDATMQYGTFTFQAHH